MTQKLLDDLREVSKQFFELPLEEKEKYPRESNGFQGYKNNTDTMEKQEMLALAVHPEDLRNFNLWPEKPEDFR